MCLISICICLYLRLSLYLTSHFPVFLSVSLVLRATKCRNEVVESDSPSGHIPDPLYIVTRYTGTQIMVTRSCGRWWWWW